MQKNDENRAALLIDADNLSPEGMAQALAHLQQLGLRVSIRRAYGSNETLGAIKDFLQMNSVKAIVNQGKGTTDAALVVDAMDLLHQGGLPSLVAIGSGDGDFTPLVLRLREAGLKLLCFAQHRKAAEGLDRVYDEVISVDSPARAATRAAATRAAPRSEAVPRAAAPRPRKTGAAKAAPAPQEPADPVSARVRQVLREFTRQSSGQDVALNSVVKKLRDEKLMAKNTSARNFFKKHAPEVLLLPENEPQKLRWAEQGRA